MTEVNRKRPTKVAKIVGVASSLNENTKELHPNGELNSLKEIRKKCFGCGDTFACSSTDDYDYCRNCEINGSRYLNKNSPCAECDGSGLIKFPNQSPRNCKLCYLANQKNNHG